MMMLNSPALLTRDIRRWEQRHSTIARLEDSVLYQHDQFVEHLSRDGFEDVVFTAHSFPYEASHDATQIDAAIRFPFIDRLGTPEIEPGKWLNTSNSVPGVGFVGADLTVDGLKGNGDKFLYIGRPIYSFTGSSDPTNVSHGLLVTESIREDKIEYGVTGGGSLGANTQFRNQYGTDDLLIGNIFGDGTPGTWPTNPDPTGFGCVTTNAFGAPAPPWKIWHVSSTSSLATLAVGTASAFDPATSANLTVFTYANSASWLTNKRYAFFFGGKTIPNEDVGGLYDLIIELRREIGGGIV